MKELPVEEIPRIEELIQRDDKGKECDNCATKIQGGGRIYRHAEKLESGYEIKFICCNCKKLT